VLFFGSAIAAARKLLGNITGVFLLSHLLHDYSTIAKNSESLVSLMRSPKVSQKPVSMPCNAVQCPYNAVTGNKDWPLADVACLPINLTPNALAVRTKFFLLDAISPSKVLHSRLKIVVFPSATAADRLCNSIFCNGVFLQSRWCLAHLTKSVAAFC
jgi:hypothetical protein